MRIAGLVGNAIIAIALVGVILFFAVPRAMGWDLVVVLSGSMEPALPVGSVIFVRPVDPAQVNVGDIITYRQGDNFVTHRVVEVSGAGPTLVFGTKGDANEQPDNGTVPAAAVKGSVWVVIPYLGFVAKEARTPRGFLLLMALPASLIVVREIRNILREIRAMRSPERPKEEAPS